MDWDFTPEDVVKGTAAYGLRDFRNDLTTELRMNLGITSEEEFTRAYAVVYDLCYWLATGREFHGYLVELGDEPDALRLAKGVRDFMQPNVAMLGAILQRLIMDRVEAGYPLEDAVRAAAEQHDRIVRGADAASDRFTPPS